MATANVSIASSITAPKGEVAAVELAAQPQSLATSSPSKPLHLPETPLSDFKVAVFGCHKYVTDFIEGPMRKAFKDVVFLKSDLKEETAPLAQGFDAVCVFVNDTIDAPTARALAAGGTRLIALRCAGYDRVDLKACQEAGLTVARVPAYSPRSVAEHALALAFSLARNLHTINERIRTGNYSLSGLIGFELSRKTYGIVGTGKIGQELCRLLRGFDARILAYDVVQSSEITGMGATYVPLEQLLAEADVVSIHTPLLPSTRHLINAERLALMKPSAILINVSRGALVDTDALLAALEGGKLGGCAMDVYESEAGLFFNNFSKTTGQQRVRKGGFDRRFAALSSLPQVLLTPHSAFATIEALDNIANTTVWNILTFAHGEPLGANEVKA